MNSDSLEHALDLFAQFFIAPLFNASSVQDEVHAVNLEHEKNLQSDGWKLWQLLKHVTNPEHPFHMFSTGTLSTLNSSHVDLLQLLHNYYNSSYSADTVSTLYTHVHLFVYYRACTYMYMYMYIHMQCPVLAPHVLCETTSAPLPLIVILQ